MDSLRADRRVLAATAAALLTLAGCGAGDSSDPEPGSRTTATPPAVRTDAAPITKRFPRLGTPIRLHWLGGAAGINSGRAPGPTDLRIQVLATLTPDVIAAAEQEPDWRPAPPGWDEAIPDQLRPYAPTAADWRVSDQFSEDVTTTRYSGTVYLDSATRTVYFAVIGG